MKKTIKEDCLQIYIPKDAGPLIEGILPLKLVRISTEKYQIKPLLFTKGKLAQIESTGIMIGYSVNDLVKSKIAFDKNRIYDFYRTDNINTYSDPNSEVVKVYTPRKTINIQKRD